MTDVPLRSILDLLDGDRINEVDFTVILTSLSRPSTITGASNVDINHLCSRVNNYLSSKKTFYRWLGCKLFVVINLHLRIIMSSHTINQIGSIVKILESHCFIDDFINPGQQELATLLSCCEALDFIIDRIRSKPALTREILTPKLPSIIAALIDNMRIIPREVLPVLFELLQKNSTTFRPFGAKFEVGLKALLDDDKNFYRLDKELTSMILQSLALVSFNLSRENPNEIWSARVHDLLLEIKSVFSIYQEILDTNQDVDVVARYNLLPKMPDEASDLRLLFGPLSVDIVETPFDVFRISKRLEALVKLLIAYLDVSSPSAVRIPLGQLVTLGELFSGMNLKFSPIKRDIRDVSTKKLIVQSVKQLNAVGISFLHHLQQRFSSDILPHYNSILATLNSVIPVKNVKGKVVLDDKEVIENSKLVLDTISTASDLIGLAELSTEPGLLNHLIDASLLITEQRLPDIEDLKGISKPVNGTKKNKKLKDNGNVAFSDIIAHQDLFVLAPDENTAKAVRKFFAIALSKSELSTANVLKIQRYAILDAVRNTKVLQGGKINPENEDIIKLLESIVLYPAHRGVGVSVIPIIYSLIGKNNDITSLLNNPRFPVPPTRVSGISEEETEVEEEEKEEEEEEDEEEEEEEDAKYSEDRKRKHDEIYESEVGKAVKKIQAANIKKVQEDAETSAKVFKESFGSATKELVKVEETFVASPVVESEEPEKESIPESDTGSDFEMPPIIVGDDDEDE